ncbi:hypothetical protein VTH06DRAFT_1866 [Thermothelomyces fergusii]
MASVRVAVEGCGHGALNAIYTAVKRACKERKWDGVDLLIIGGDFQAARNAADLNAMSVPPKYRQLGDFHEYYSGTRRAPFLTIFVGGNHEAASHLWELYYGGWVAPNIYYMGAANVLRLGPLRIAGMSGIYKGFDYLKPHHERLPFSHDDIRSFYHVREIDVRKLLQVRSQVDIGISHDWPRGIEKYGNRKRLFKMKPDFERESRAGELGSPAAESVLNWLRPRYWFSAHLHCQFAAIKQFPPVGGPREGGESAESVQADPAPAVAETNPDEIALDVSDDGDSPDATPAAEEAAAEAAAAEEAQDTEALRAQLPEAFAKPAQGSSDRPVPGQPVPPGITNTTTRFLALDKCLPRRKFLQLLEIPAAHLDTNATTAASPGKAKKRKGKLRLQYDPEWLSIVRAFHPMVQIGTGGGSERAAAAAAAAAAAGDEERFRALIEEHRAWVDEHIVATGRLAVPDNFAITAPPHRPRVDHPLTRELPREWTNPQTAAFCELLGLENYWDATEEERKARMESVSVPGESGGKKRGGSGKRGRGKRGR